MSYSDDYLYFLKIDNGPWRAVSKADWVNAERSAGFVNTMGRPDEPGTASFRSSTRNEEIEGRYIHPSSFVAEVYDYDPDFRDAAAAEIATLRSEGK